MSEFIGKFHPLLVHLPIGFLVLLGIFEILACRGRRQEMAAAVRVVLIVTLPVSLASVVCGWLLAENGDYDGRLLFWHRWLGAGLGAAGFVLLALHWGGRLRIYRWALAGTMGLLVATGHFGGSLTHGSGYLSWPTAKASPDLPASTGNIMAQPVHPAVIQPIFNRYCVNCHGTEKSKGGLRLDTAENLLKGGDSGPAIKPAGSNQSLLGKQLSLPVDDEYHMPPEGKRQLSDDELALVRWWLDAGAPVDRTVQELNPPPEILRILASPPSSVSGQAINN